jgi:hypothetical protein
MCWSLIFAALEMSAERISEWNSIVRANLTFESAFAAASHPATWPKVREPSPDKGFEIESEESESDTSAKEYFSSKDDLVGLGILWEGWFPMKFEKIGRGMLTDVVWVNQ